CPRFRSGWKKARSRSTQSSRRNRPPYQLVAAAVAGGHMITTMTVARRASTVLAFSALMLAACGGPTGGTAATASPSPSPTATPSQSAAPIVLAQNVGSMGTILDAASNSHTAYTLTRDTPGVTKCKAS